MIARLHYSQDQLEAFLDEQDAEGNAEVYEHLETCEQCQATLEELSAKDFDWSQASSLLGEVDAFDKGSDDAEGIDLAPKTLSFLNATDDANSIGKFGRYEVLEVLGRGGTGIVLRGFDPELSRQSAIKVLAPEFASSSAARKRFSREAKSAAAVIHPNVIDIHTVEVADGLPYLVMPVVEGESLQQRVINEGPLSVLETVRIAIQVAEGLGAAHEQGLVHRDIKPANILLENGVERVQITDFGLARAADDASMTRSGVIAGTPQYMSPEQAHGDEVDHRSDLFSLGSLIYFMLTGRSPFRAETTMGVLNRICSDKPRSLGSINPEIPSWLEDVVCRLLEKDRAMRFTSAAEVADELHPWLAHLQSPSDTPPPLAVSHGRSRLKRIIGRGIDVWRSSKIRFQRLPSWLLAVMAISVVGLSGVMLLELSSGTLRIENNANVDVPIVIRRGEKVVEELTVSSDGLTTKLLAGKYEIEIKDKSAEYELSGNAVTLSWRGNWLATISMTSNDADTSRSAANDSETASSEGYGDGIATGRPLLFWFRGSKGIKIGEEEVARPIHDGMGMTLFEGEGSRRFTLVGPSQKSIECTLMLSQHGHSDWFWQQLENVAVPLSVSLNELRGVEGGEPLTKVVAVSPLSVKPTFVTLSSGPSRTAAETLLAAKQRGEIACVLMIGKSKRADHSEIFDSAAPSVSNTVALVHAVVDGKHCFYPVDSDGSILDTSEYTSADVESYFLIYAQGFQPEIERQSRHYKQPEILEAIALCEYLEPMRDRLGLTEIEIHNDSQGGELQRNFIIGTKDGPRINWGTALGKEKEIEPSAQEKVAQLATWLADRRRVGDALRNGGFLDLRHSKLVDPRNSSFDWDLTEALPETSHGNERDVVARSNGVERSTLANLPAPHESVLSVDLTADKGIRWLFNRATDHRERFPFPMAVYSSYTAEMELINDAEEIVILKMEVLCNERPNEFWNRLADVRIAFHLSSEEFTRVLNGATIRKIAGLKEGEKTVETYELDGRTQPIGNAEPILSFEISPAIVPFSKGWSSKVESVTTKDSATSKPNVVDKVRTKEPTDAKVVAEVRGTAIVLVMDKIASWNDDASLPHCAQSIVDQLETGDALGILVQGETEPVWLWGGEDGVVKLDGQVFHWRKAIEQAELRDVTKWEDTLQRVVDALVDYNAIQTHVILLTDDEIHERDVYAELFKKLRITASVIDVENGLFAGNYSLPHNTNSKYYRTSDELKASDVELILTLETNWAKGEKVDWDSLSDLSSGTIYEYHNNDEGEPALLTTEEDVEEHIRNLVANRQSIGNSEVQLKITHSGSNPFTRRYHVWLNGNQRRSDCVGIHSNGRSKYTHIVTPQFNWYGDALDPSLSQYSQSDPTEPVGWGTLGCILDLKKIGMVNWSVESLDSHAFDQDLWPEGRENVEVTIGEHDGRKVTVVKIKRRNERTADPWVEIRLDPSQGNYPVYLAKGWTDANDDEKKYVVTLQTDWLVRGKYWYPSSLTYEYTCEARGMRDRSEIEILKATFDQDPFPSVFDPLEEELE